MKIPKNILITLILLGFIIPLGFYSKIYSGMDYEWVNNKLGGILYEIFWCLLVYVLMKNIKPLRIAVAVFIVTAILEFSQLLDNDFLNYIRSGFIGRSIVGSTFSWSDFLYYMIGSFMGLAMLKWLEKFKA